MGVDRRFAQRCFHQLRSSSLAPLILLQHQTNQRYKTQKDQNPILKGYKPPKRKEQNA